MKEAVAHVLATMAPLVPRPTGWVPKLPRLEGIEAVIFDLYGTLLISAAGGGSHETGAGIDGIPGIEALYWETVRVHQERRRVEGIDHPEVEIREVWRDLLPHFDKSDATPAEVEALALRHECRVNPVWPMPGAAGMLACLRQSGRRLGILSNAQFYTLPVMEGLFGGGLDTLGFDPDLRIFSFEEREGKPSPRLFQGMRDRLAVRGITAEATFYLGNDLQKDILPARAVGFRTGLFAGDALSLRLGGVPETEAVDLADAVITDLAQVPGLF